MIYNLGRIGPYLSDRILLTKTREGHFSLRTANSFWDWVKRVISWIYSPASYTEENRRTVQCFKEMLASIGAARLQRICNRYNINLDEMQRKGSPLLSRDVAKIGVALADPQIEEMNRILFDITMNPAHLPPLFPDDLRKRLKGAATTQDLSGADFAKLYEALRAPAKSFPLPPMAEVDGSCPTEWPAWFSFDQFLADRERLILQQNPPDNLHAFILKFCIQGMRRQMPVGTIIPAPNHKVTKAKQFYLVSGVLVTGDGLVSIFVQPATKDTDLETIQFFRGTSTTPGEIDAFSSILTDLELQIGKSAWESREQYQPWIDQCLPPMRIVAGHSLGATLAQLAIVENKQGFTQAVCSSGPALLEELVQKFNARMQREKTPFEIDIYDAEGDGLSAMGGGAHIGYQAPPNVKVQYHRYRKNSQKNSWGVHTKIWHETRICGIEGGHSSKDLDRHLYHKTKKSFNWLREMVGPVLATILRLVRDVFRCLFGSRTLALRGLQLGTYERGPYGMKWTERHIRPLT